MVVVMIKDILIRKENYIENSHSALTVNMELWIWKYYANHLIKYRINVYKEHYVGIFCIIHLNEYLIEYGIHVKGIW